MPLGDASGDVPITFASSMFQVAELLRFYWRAVTRYQLHAPFAYAFGEEVVEDGRHYYAFEAIERLRAEMLRSTIQIEKEDFGAGPSDSSRDASGSVLRITTIGAEARSSGSSPQQGRRLFRLVRWLQPQRMLELGTSLGIGTAYMAAAAASTAKIISLEGAPACARAAREHLDMLQLSGQVDIRVGAFEQTYAQALHDLEPVDFIYFDGNHRHEPTLAYFAASLDYLSPQGVLVFDDIHWSEGMSAAWKTIQNHPKVTLTIDCWDFACAFVNPDFSVKQHFNVIPSRWKPWKIY
jgi:predicted O-methyltransferase YrrM